MTELAFLPSDAVAHRSELVELNIEYLTWVLTGFSSITGTSVRDMLGMDIPQYVDKGIYVRHGFTDRPPYDEVEAPKALHPIIRFMERAL